MKTRFVRGLLLGVVSTAFAVQLNALTIGGSGSIGLINDGIPSNLADELTYINTLIAQPAPSGPTLIGTETYTRTALTFGTLPTVVLTGAVKFDLPADPTTPNTPYSLGTGFTYLLAKYDAANAGSYVWYVGGLTGSVDVPSFFSGQQYALSHISVFNPSGGGDIPGTPDGGTTAVLLGLSLIGLRLLTRRFTV